MPDLQLSPDGAYYWDGRAWVSTLSHDRLYRWDGGAWVPLPGSMAANAARGPRVPTRQTRQLQIAVIAWYTIQACWAVVIPFYIAGSMRDYVAQVIQEQQARTPDAQPLPANFVPMVSSIISVSLVIGGIFGLALAVVAIIGAIRRWRWLYYTVLVLLGLGALFLPFSLVSAPAGSVPLPLNVQLLRWVQFVTGIPGAALFVWMLVALVRHGPWAMSRPIESAARPALA